MICKLVGIAATPKKRKGTQHLTYSSSQQHPLQVLKEVKFQHEWVLPSLCASNLRYRTCSDSRLSVPEWPEYVIYLILQFGVLVLSWISRLRQGLIPFSLFHSNVFPWNKLNLIGMTPRNLLHIEWLHGCRAGSHVWHYTLSPMLSSHVVLFLSAFFSPPGAARNHFLIRRPQAECASACMTLVVRIT